MRWRWIPVEECVDEAGVVDRGGVEAEGAGGADEWVGGYVGGQLGESCEDVTAVCGE